MQVQRLKTCFIYHIYLKSMKQKNVQSRHKFVSTTKIIES